MENVLSRDEHDHIKFTFTKNLSSKNYVEILKMKSDSIELKKINVFINKNSFLRKLSNEISKNVFGKVVAPKEHFFHSKAVKLPDYQFPGDNIFHVDRYLPNLKLIYFPNSVNKDQSPFKYAIGSHKINQDYLNFF